MIGGNLILDWSGFTLWPTLVWWRTSSMDEKMTWHPRWQHFLREFLTRGQASCPASTPWTKNWASGQGLFSIKYCFFCANRNAVATLALLQIQVFQTISPS